MSQTDVVNFLEIQSKNAVVNEKIYLKYAVGAQTIA